ncbi:glucan biosynthesis protein [Aquisalimonas sp.]|uniref:glucan biosynthesis protein n=1 Tax=Aquisalimonas sp. TaxID=1872621 RepID=UPI0025BBABAA|nr:glucan biosynthesis protein [Aquisalimonas sp.]
MPRHLDLLLTVGLLAATVPARVAGGQVFDAVTEMARERADSPHVPPPVHGSGPLADLDYDTYRQIRFRPEAALWRDDDHGFSVQLFHPGFLFDSPVRVYTVDGEDPEPLSFDTAFFDYDGDAAGVEADAGEPGGFAGFRIHYPVNRPGVHDEVAAFLGASYFRLVGRDQVYGLSSRGLAVDTVGAEEEFPAFRAFWLQRPAEGATRMEVVALLDSPSVTGSYRFQVRVEPRVTVDVEKRLFARRTIHNLGVAPLTSMFSHGQPSTTQRDDFRPRVHDSDGLLAETHAGERIWRPLINPGTVRVTALQDHDPRGFGLVQRDRRFASYLDLEANYHRRPSHWVAPDGDWGSGAVQLVEIPAAGETDDNIVAYWAPDEPFKAGGQRTYRYRLTPYDRVPDPQGLARVVRTRSGWAAIPGESDPPPRTHRRFIVDFRGGELGDGEELEPQLRTTSGDVDDVQIMPLPEPKAWRASFRLRPQGETPADMQLYLHRNGERLSETWSFVWYPDER